MALNSTPQAVHVDEFLTSFAISYATEQNYLADRVFPSVSVEKRSDKFYIFDAAEENREFTNAVTKLAPRTKPRMIDVTQSDSSYFCEIYGLGFEMEVQTEANEDAILRTRQRKAKRVMDNLLKARDRDFIDAFMKTGVWGEDLAGGSDFTKWDDAASTPIDDVMKWKEDFKVRNYGLMPNKVVMTGDLKRILMGNAQILGRINGGATVANPAMVNDATIASIFEVEEIVYADVISNQANHGQAENAARMISDQLLLTHTPSDVDIETPAAGMIFAWNSVPGVDWGISMESFTGDYLSEEGISERVQGKMVYDMQVTGAKLGTYVSDLYGS